MWVFQFIKNESRQPVVAIAITHSLRKYNTTSVIEILCLLQKNAY